MSQPYKLDEALLKRYVNSMLDWYYNAGEQAGAEAALLSSNFHEVVKQYVVNDTNDELVMKSCNAILALKLRSILGPIAQFHKLCESPIERVMLSAITTYAAIRGVAVTYDEDDYANKIHGSISHARWIGIQPQCYIGKYRVDFCLIYALTGGRGNRLRARMVVECDGHEFHERTKEQAQRDKERDRYLQTQGFNVFRFTGSEIWADAFKCAAQVVEALDMQVESQFKEMDRDRRLAFVGADKNGNMAF